MSNMTNYTTATVIRTVQIISADMNHPVLPITPVRRWEHPHQPSVSVPGFIMRVMGPAYETTLRTDPLPEETEAGRAADAE